VVADDEAELIEMFGADLVKKMEEIAASVEQDEEVTDERYVQHVTRYDIDDFFLIPSKTVTHVYYNDSMEIVAAESMQTNGSEKGDEGSESDDVLDDVLAELDKSFLDVYKESDVEEIHAALGRLGLL